MSDVDSCSFNEPDCVKCLRKKLQAIGVVVFFQNDQGWQVGNFQGDKPSQEAEVDFEIMLNSKVPETIQSFGQGLLINDNEVLKSTLPNLVYLLENSSVVAAPVCSGRLSGVRLAWREADQPFTQDELTIMQCFGACPAGCAA